VVGGQPRTDPCNGRVAIGGCGVAVNAAAYQASDGPALEQQYPQQCSAAPRAFDCGPGYPTCTQGKCVIQGFGCCFGCSFDGGTVAPADAAIRDALDVGGAASVDVGVSPLDGSRG